MPKKMKISNSLLQFNSICKNENITFSTINFAASGVNIDRDKKIIQKALIFQSGLTSDKRFNITEENIQNFYDVAKKTESLKVHFEHDTSFSSKVERSLRFVAELKNIKKSNTQIRADIVFAKASLNYDPKLIDFIFDRIEAEEKDFGLSANINADFAFIEYSEGRGENDPIYQMVKIHSVLGADFVEYPAATSSIDFSIEKPEESKQLKSIDFSIEKPEDNKQNVTNIKGEIKKMDREKLLMYAKLFNLSVDELQKIQLSCKDDSEDSFKKAVEAYYDEKIDLNRILEKQKKAMAFGEDNLKDNLKDDPKSTDFSSSPHNTPNIKMSTDQLDKSCDILTKAAMVQFGVERDKTIIDEVRGAGAGVVSLQGLLRKCSYDTGEVNLAMADSNTMFDKVFSFSEAASSTRGQFINILSNILRKSALKGYETSKATYELFTDKDYLKDFKTHNLVGMTELSSFKSTSEGKLTEYAKFTDYKEQATLNTKAAAILLNRQTIIDDDMRMFTKIPNGMSRALKRTENRDCFLELYNGQGANTAFAGSVLIEPTSKAMFSTAAGQANLAAAGSALTETSLDAGWLHILRLKGKAPEDGEMAPCLNLTPKFLIIPPTEQKAAFQLTRSMFLNTSDTYKEGSMISNIYAPNQARNPEIIVEPTLENLIEGQTSYPWYLFASPNDAATITYFRLLGYDAPFAITEPVPAREGRGTVWFMEFDYSFKSVGWKGSYCNPGATL